MSILQINFWILFILALLQYYILGTHSKKNIYLLMCLDLMFFAIFRAPDVGADWTSYVYTYQRIVNMSWQQIFDSVSFLSGSELGYTILNKLISLISENPQALVIVLALIVFPVQFVLIYKYSDRPGLSLLVYVAMDGFEFGYTYLRQACAYTFIIFSFKYIRERKFLKFFVFVFIAFLFHRSAILVIPFYFLYDLKLDRKIISIFFISSVLLFLTGGILMHLIFLILGKAYVNEFIAGRNRFFFMWIMAILIYELLIRKILIDKKAIWSEEEKEHYKLLMMSFLLASTIQSLAMVSAVFVRASEYFNWSMYILFSKSSDFLISSRYREAFRLISIIFMAVVMYLFYSSVLAGDYHLMWS